MHGIRASGENRKSQVSSAVVINTSGNESVACKSMGCGCLGCVNLTVGRAARCQQCLALPRIVDVFRSLKVAQLGARLQGCRSGVRAGKGSMYEAQCTLHERHQTLPIPSTQWHRSKLGTCRLPATLAPGGMPTRRGHTVSPHYPPRTHKHCSSSCCHLSGHAPCRPSCLWLHTAAPLCRWGSCYKRPCPAGPGSYPACSPHTAGRCWSQLCQSRYHAGRRGRRCCLASWCRCRRGTVGTPQTRGRRRTGQWGTPTGRQIGQGQRQQPSVSMCVLQQEPCMRLSSDDCPSADSVL